MTPICGIYAFIHRDTGACYVGSSANILKRLYAHRTTAKTAPVTTRFYRHFRKHGESEYDFEILEECKFDELLERERFYIALLDSAGANGLNVKASPNQFYLGYKHTDESRERIRLGKLGTHEAPEVNARRYGRKRTLESRIKQSASMIGRKLSDATKQKISAVHLGKKKSVAHRAKMSARLKGKRFYTSRNTKAGRNHASQIQLSMQ